MSGASNMPAKMPNKRVFRWMLIELVGDKEIVAVGVYRALDTVSANNASESEKKYLFGQRGLEREIRLRSVHSCDLACSNWIRTGCIY